MINMNNCKSHITLPFKKSHAKDLALLAQ